MADVETPSQTSKKSSNWLTWVVGASLAYIGVILVILQLYSKTPSDPGCAGSYLGCLDPNQIGDVVAGVFAPLGFFWLVAAVWMQSRELQNQQQEIRSQRKSLNNAEVRSMIDQLHATLQDRINGKVSVTPQQGDSYKILEIPPSDYVDKALYLMSKGLQKSAAASEVGIRNGQLSITQADRGHLEIVHAATSEIVVLGKDALLSQQTRIKHLDLHGLREAIEVFLKCRWKDAPEMS